MFRRLIAKVLVLTVSVVLPSSALAFEDPTRPTSFQASKQASTLRLESILYSDVRKVAVINGKVLAEGESIGGKKITHIGKESVKLARGKNELTLTLKRSSIRQVK